VKLRLDNGFDLRPAVTADAETVAGWMNQPHVRQWWHQDWPPEQWAAALAEQAAGGHSIPCMTALDGEELGYVELYRARHDRLAEYYASEEHDWGVHIAIGDTSRVGRGIGRRLLSSLAGALFEADPQCHRVVAEPDAANTPSVRAFAAAGFVTQGELRLPEKTALLMVRPRTVEV
jgi:RimJ/RimL family protein N-acetyltransferase